MITIKSNYILLLCLLLSSGIFAQTKKLEKSYKTKQDVSVIIDAKYTNIIIENWDKNEVAIEAYLDAGKLKNEDAKKALESWKMETSGNLDKIEINSGGGTGMNLNMDMDLSSLNESLGNLQDLLGPMMTDMIAPMLENISKNPLPPEFHEKMGNMDFDYEAYKKDGDKYMEKWEKKMEKNFGKDFEKSMEAWGKQFEKNSAVWEKDFEKKMEAWGEDFEKNFGKDMEKWGEDFGKKMELWGENFGKQMEEKNMGKGDANARTSSQGIRIIKIKMPRNAKLDLNLRYGELKLGEKTTNLKADLSHSNFTANIIEGDKTQVKVSYSPVNVNVWNYGVLKTNYVENCEIGKVKSIKLISNSSDVNIREITETGILSGTFGELAVGKLGAGFKNLDINLENSDLRLSLPSAPLNFNYKGTQSNIEYPKSASIKSTKSYDNEILNGYYKSKDGNGSVNINASFSDVYIK